jgi:hypothetical protein
MKLSSFRGYFSKLPPIVWIYVAFFWLALTLLSIALNYYRGYIKGLPYPFNSSYPPNIFGDFYWLFDEWVKSGGFGGVSYGGLYFPTSYLFLHIINLATNDSRVFSLILSTSIWFLGGSFIIFKFLKNKGFVLTAIVLAAIVFSYPSLFLMHTGNFEGWIGFLILAAGISASSGRWTLFSVFIGVAASIKGVPLIFSLIPFTIFSFKKSLQFLLQTFATIFVATFISLFTLPGGFLSQGFLGVKSALTGIRGSQAKYNDLMVNSEAGTHYGHSFLNAIHSIFGLETLPSTRWGVLIFWIFIINLFFLLILMRKAGTELWIKFLAVSSTACLAMATSTDYKLIYLAIPVLLATTSKLASPLDRVLLFIIIFAMSSKPYLYTGINEFANATVYLTSASLLMILVFCYFKIFISPRTFNSDSKTIKKFFN